MRRCWCGRPLGADNAGIECRQHDISHRPTTLEVIVDTVCQYYQVSVIDLWSPKKNKKISHPRNIAMYLMRRDTSALIQDVGASIGRSRVSVFRAHTKIRAELTRWGGELNAIAHLYKDKQKGAREHWGGRRYPRRAGKEG